MQAWRTANRGVLITASVSVAVLFLVPTSARAEAALVEGQTATGGTTHSFSQDQPTQADAINAAMNNCATTSFNCHVIRQFSNTCFALAYAQGGGYGYAFGSDLPEAHRAALGQCSAANPYSRCDVVRSFCDTVNQQQAEAQRRQYVQDWYACANDHDQSACERDLAIATSDGDRAQLTQWLDALQQAAAAASQQAVTKDFDSDLNECGSFSIAACDRGLASPLASAADIDNMKGWRASAVAYTENRTACKAGDVSACDAALASPAITDTGRQLIAAWRNNSPPSSSPLPKSRAALDPVTFVVGVLVFLGLTLVASFAAVSGSRREAVGDSAGASAAPTLHTEGRHSGVVVAATEPPPIPLFEEAAEKAVEPSRALVTAPEPSIIPPPIDTPAALRALKIASAYLAEFAERPDYADEQQAKTARTTLSLAARQLDLAHKADPNAVLELDDVRLSQAQLRSRVLLTEAESWYPYNSSKAIALAQKAKAADPDNVDAWYWSGWFNFQQRNQEAALRDFERTLELDPDNIQALKFLDRTQNMGGMEIAAFKVVNARDNTLFAVGKTIGILRVPFLIATAPFRFVFFVGKALYLLWIDPWHYLRR